MFTMDRETTAATLVVMTVLVFESRQHCSIERLPDRVEVTVTGGFDACVQNTTVVPSGLANILQRNAESHLGPGPLTITAGGKPLPLSATDADTYCKAVSEYVLVAKRRGDEVKTPSDEKHALTSGQD
jgi:hypothetical protein